MCLFALRRLPHLDGPFDQVYLNELEKALRIRNMMVRLKEDKILANLVKDRSLETELSWKHGLKMLIL